MTVDNGFAEAKQLEAEAAAYDAWCDKEMDRGDMAFQPETLGCFECGGFDGHTEIPRRVVRLGPVVDRADPTQTYVLECGHTTI